MKTRIPVVLAVLCVAACGRATPPPAATEIAAVPRVSLPEDPSDPAWKELPSFDAALLLQDMVEPRLLEPSIASVRVQAASDGRRLAFRLAWDDPTLDDELRPGGFSDACAVQLPVAVQPDVPAPQMGEAGKPVEIVLWRAAWQATVDGRPDTLEALYPRASIDHYPFEAPPLAESSDRQREMAALYSPARALENDMSGPREKPVQQLIAAGPGTLERAATNAAEGRGLRDTKGWSVVISTPVPTGLADGARTQVAIAVWNGSHGEVGARKMRSAWIPLLLEARP